MHVPTLNACLENVRTLQPDGPALAGLLEDIASVARDISHRIRRGALSGVLGSAGTENVQGETQKKLDVLANDLLLEALDRGGHCAALASEEMDHACVLDDSRSRARLLCLFDPLDGSSNIDVNITIGTIFSVLPAPDGPLDDASFLQPGTAQRAAGFVLYGPSTLLALTIGQGVDLYTLDPDTGEFRLTRPDVRIPEDSSEFAINASNHRFWAAPVRRYIDECLAGKDGPRGRNFNMRWVASMVADTYRVLARGGVFLYPWDSREPGKAGKLRLMYEANPASFLIEQAGGMSCAGSQRLLELQPTSLHQRVPLMLGSRHEIERLAAYHRDT